MSDDPSFRKIDYTLRPAKNIERKMLAEIIGRLAVFRPLGEYFYIGLGSVYFTDFALFHRLWGLSPMYSIEKDEEGIGRAEFNLPFSCVEVRPGKSAEQLPAIPFAKPSIVWLDYDTELFHGILEDVQTVIDRQCRAGYSGVALIVTVDAESKRLEKPKSVDDEELEDWPEDPLEQFRRLVGEANVPATLALGQLQGGALAETYRTLITNRILATVADVGGWSYFQFANLRYADGAEMATFGGIVYRQEDEETRKRARFEALPFSRTADDLYRIEAPKLTFREMQALSRAVDEKEHPSAIPVDESEFQRFKLVYRYFPAFVEAEL